MSRGESRVHIICLRQVIDVLLVSVVADVGGSCGQFRVWLDFRSFRFITVCGEVLSIPLVLVVEEGWVVVLLHEPLGWLVLGGRLLLRLSRCSLLLLLH